jgi:hypothetical protein
MFIAETVRGVEMNSDSIDEVLPDVGKEFPSFNFKIAPNLYLLATVSASSSIDEVDEKKKTQDMEIDFENHMEGDHSQSTSVAVEMEISSNCSEVSPTKTPTTISESFIGGIKEKKTTRDLKFSELSVSEKQALWHSYLQTLNEQFMREVVTPIKPKKASQSFVLSTSLEDD